MRKICGFIVMALLVVGVAQAQSKSDATKLYNAAIGLMKTDASLAIDSIEKCIAICTQIGDSAAVLKEKATTLAPDLYYQKAYTLYSVDKKIPESIQAARLAGQVAEKYNNAKTKDKVEKLLATAYTTLGISYLKANDAEKAVKAFDSVSILSPNNYKVLFNKALAYKKLENVAKFTETVDLCIEKAKAANDTVQSGQANKLALEYFRASGNKASQANKLAEAITLLNSAFKYGNDKDVYYYLANVYNKQKKYDEALSNIQKGLAMETGAPEAKAKFYYEQGVAQAGKGDKENACTSFTSAALGPFEAASKAQMTNLKCGK